MIVIPHEGGESAANLGILSGWLSPCSISGRPGERRPPADNVRKRVQIAEKQPPADTRRRDKVRKRFTVSSTNRDGLRAIDLAAAVPLLPRVSEVQARPPR
jgi:hypothetical protein